MLRVTLQQTLRYKANEYIHQNELDIFNSQTPFYTLFHWCSASMKPIKKDVRIIHRGECITWEVNVVAFGKLWATHSLLGVLSKFSDIRIVACAYEGSANRAFL